MTPTARVGRAIPVALVVKGDLAGRGHDQDRAGTTRDGPDMSLEWASSAGGQPARHVSCRAVDDRETLRILLHAHHQFIADNTIRMNQLRALLLCGNKTERALARGRLGETTVAKLAARSFTPGDYAGDVIEQVPRETAIQRLAGELGHHRAELADNLVQLRALVDALAPGLTAQHRVGPITAAEAILHSRRCSPATRINGVDRGG